MGAWVMTIAIRRWKSAGGASPRRSCSTWGLRWPRSSAASSLEASRCSRMPCTTRATPPRSGIAYAAQRISRRPADQIRTFGYRRAETVGAVINLTTLLAIAVFLIYQAVDRLANPSEVGGMTMMIVGAIAFVEDAVSAWLLYRGARGSLNIRAAFLHMIGDSLATLGVLIGGFLIVRYGAYWIDPAITAAIALYLLVHGSVEIRRAVRILMESAPEGFDFDRMMKEVHAVEGSWTFITCICGGSMSSASRLKHMWR